jgi:SAM-dependent methyltransferase
MATGFYGADLAHVHHSGFGDLSTGAAPALVAIFRKAGIRRGTVVDLGCGGGQWLRKLGDAGYDAIGIDVSRALAKLARREAPRARVLVGSVYTVPLPACDAVTALGEVLGYLPSAGARIPSFAQTFRRVARALRPGGVFAFDLIVRDPAHPIATRNFRVGADWTVLADTREDRSRSRLRRTITTFRRVGAHWRRTDEVHRVRVPSREEIVAALRSAGFASVRAGRRYGRHALAPHRLAFVARRG